ncbi:hypothetical protein D3C77_264910 [compost metagenome]
MKIDSAQDETFAVYLHYPFWIDAHFTEADIRALDIDDIPGGIDHFQYQFIEIRIFIAP